MATRSRRVSLSEWNSKVASRGDDTPLCFCEVVDSMSRVTQVRPASEDQTSLEPQTQTAPTEGLTCRTCSMQFGSLAEQRDHFRSDSHASAVAEDASCAAAEGEEDEEDREEGSPFVSWTHGDTQYSMFKCVVRAVSGVGGEREVPMDVGSLRRFMARTGPGQSDRWAVFLCSGGGHVAGAVFEGRKGEAVAVVHRTLSRYTTRKKQGSSQSARDNRGGGAHIQSAGAAIRRHNEKRLVEQVHEMVMEWAPLLQACKVVLYSTPKVQRLGQLLFFEGSPLNEIRAACCRVPVTINRPTFAEARRIHALLSSVSVATGDRPPTELAETEPLQPDVVTVDQLVNACASGDKAFVEHCLSGLVTVDCKGTSSDGRIAAHCAVRSGSLDILEMLVEDGGADVSAVEPKSGMTCAQLCRLRVPDCIVEYVTGLVAESGPAADDSQEASVQNAKKKKKKKKASKKTGRPVGPPLPPEPVAPKQSKRTDAVVPPAPQAAHATVLLVDPVECTLCHKPAERALSFERLGQRFCSVEHLLAFKAKQNK